MSRAKRLLNKINESVDSVNEGFPVINVEPDLYYHGFDQGGKFEVCSKGFKTSREADRDSQEYAERASFELDEPADNFRNEIILGSDLMYQYPKQFK